MKEREIAKKLIATSLAFAGGLSFGGFMILDNVSSSHAQVDGEKVVDCNKNPDKQYTLKASMPVGEKINLANSKSFTGKVLSSVDIVAKANNGMLVKVWDNSNSNINSITIPGVEDYAKSGEVMVSDDNTVGFVNNGIEYIVDPQPNPFGDSLMVDITLSCVKSS